MPARTSTSLICRVGARGVACALLATFLALCASGVAGGSKTRSQSAQTAHVIPASQIESLAELAGTRVRVTFFLSDNSLTAKLDSRRPELTGRLPGARAARAAALRSPKRRTAQEARVAAMMDDQRNAALPAIRSAARSGTLQSERVARAIKRVGGRVESATPIPNTITAVLPANALATITGSSDVNAVVHAEKPVLASSPVDGSETWHSSGFTGGGTSADGNGGPDYVAFDTGLRTSHAAFRTRVPGDCATCVGSGPSRVISPAGRTDFSGSKHGNTVGAAVAATDLGVYGTGGAPWPPTWQNRKGQAYGLDNLYDTYEAKNAYRWWLGVTYNGEPGVADLPEVVNYSAGIYEDSADSNFAWSPVDASVSQYGIAYTVSAGNCGIADPGYTGCGDGPHRVSTPGNNFNVITAGGLDIQGQPYNQTSWTVWPNSSPGPTYGGRKKPDLIAQPYPAAGTPSQNDDTSYTSGGSGTSYAAPQAASGVALLASTGVYSPTAQKAILINSATPIQGQTYWMPRSGWGALNLDGAFIQRANYANGAVTPAGANGARFYRVTGVAVGDRTTLVWNRRLGNYTGNNAPPYSTLTNLDLFQFAEGDACSPGCTPTATGGVDANDTVDTDQTVTVDNPMPGNGSDGPDNVEQVRSTGTGTQIVKVKAISTIDGTTAEPFSLAADHTLDALETPIPAATLNASPAAVAPNDTVTVNATIANPSADLALTGAQITLSLPAGVTLESGALTQSLGTIAASGSANASWQVSGAATATHNLTATVTGSTYGETFSGEGSDSFSVDSDAPTVTAASPGEWSIDPNAAFTWSATDGTGVSTYDIELSRDGGPFSVLAAGTTSTSASIGGTEGETLAIRVRATDTLGNVSGWTTASTTIDAIGPEATIGSESFPARNVLNAPVSVANVGGAPVTGSFSFSGAGSESPFIDSAIASFTNTRVKDFATTLTVRATDTLGRVATATRNFSVPSLYVNPGLRITGAKARSGRLRLRGAVSKEYRGKLTVTVARIGKRGTKRVRKRVQVTRGRFVLSISLKPGRYRLNAISGARGTMLAGRATKIVRVS